MNIKIPDKDSIERQRVYRELYRSMNYLENSIRLGVYNSWQSAEVIALIKRLKPEVQLFYINKLERMLK